MQREAALGKFEWVILAPIMGLLVWELISVRRAIRQAEDKPAQMDAGPAEPTRRWGAGLRDRAGDGDGR